MMKDNISIERMFEIQAELHEKYSEKFGERWFDIVPENGHYSLLWAMGEMGEIVDIIKKQGHEKIMSDKSP